MLMLTCAAAFGALIAIDSPVRVTATQILNPFIGPPSLIDEMVNRSLR